MNSSETSHKYSLLTLLALVLFCSAMTGCSSGYDNGFKDGKAEGVKEGKQAGLEQGRAEGFNAGYQKGREEATQNREPSLKTIDSVFLNSNGTKIMFWIFSILNLVVLAIASIYLVIRVPILPVRIAKSLTYVVAIYLWFRLVQDLVVSNALPLGDISIIFRTIVELTILILSFLLCRIYHRLYIKNKTRFVWADCLGIGFCTILFLQGLHFLINWDLVFSKSDPMFALRLVLAFSVGGIIYTITALLREYVIDKFVIAAEE